ncbi:MAG: GNAT family N-acetyltransferase [Oscillospiraceae bacterium]|nr:GNAT family N-acetyltransferase [Oscillospiraceae bacterium]
MRIDYKELTIRNAEAADAAQLTAWWNDGSVMAHAGYPKGLGTTVETVTAELAAHTDDTKRRLILEISGEPVGEMSYRNLNDGSVEIGIKICDRSKQEKGHGRTFLSMLISELFTMGYQKIVLDTNWNNKRAQHVYESLGFQKVRFEEKAWQDQLGQWQGSVDYELLPEDFIDYRN